MQRYLILRRRAWLTAEDVCEAVQRAAAEHERRSDEIRSMQSYVVCESDGSIGMACLYEATSPEAVRAHAKAARLPVDEIVGVLDVIAVGNDSPTVATA